jgi:membrane-bound lytic murein transglycosylase A
LVHLAKNISADNSANPPPRPANNFFTSERTYRSLALFREILISASDEGEFERRVRECFAFWEANREGKANPTLLTGYYEPIIEGDLEPGGEYLYPIYRRPDDLVEVMGKDLSSEGLGVKRVVRVEKGQTIPYYSRQEIDDQGALRGKGYELAWLKDPWERFLLHVQGSGQIRLPKGETRRVGFSGSNGRPYRSIGRYLIDRGFLAEKPLSLSRVKEFLRQNPERVAETFNANERYIFFRFVPGKEGPLGALGFPLTAGRSIATDQAIFPRGALAYLIAQQPIFDATGRLKGRKTLRRFVLNQDTGAAMKGPERIDLFFGSGEQAGMTAGEMCEEGRIYFLQAR